MTVDDLVKQIADYYGLEHQSKICARACGKLTAAVIEVASIDNLSYYRSVYDVAEEIADVTIVIMQMMYLLDIPDQQIEDIIDEKLRRKIDEINRKEMGHKA